MKIMAFDLSTSCVGVVTADIDDNTKQIKKALSCPIIPRKFSPEVLGYLKSKKKLSTKSGEILNTYARPGEVQISKAEKERRDREVRGKKDIWVLEDISATMGKLINTIKPNLILVEKNVAGYNGMLTIVLLAKVMGTLLGISGMLGIPVEEYAVNKVRSVFNISQLIRDFTANKTAQELQQIPDITKRALRVEMERRYGKYGIKFQTDDESDGAVVLNYWFTELYRGNY
jgi:hypothetical protein